HILLIIGVMISLANHIFSPHEHVYSILSPHLRHFVSGGYSSYAM
ncbi:uncharacterized protein METZ01_LOCUS281310, partial [marine metagenome]